MIRCENCGTANYTGLSTCPHCNMPLTGGLSANSGDETLPPQSKPKPPFVTALLAAITWLIGSGIFILVAEPYGRRLSSSESAEATGWVLVPAAVIFLLVYVLKNLLGGPRSGALSTTLDTAFMRRQRQELETFVDSLAAVDAEELGLPVAFAANFRNTMLREGIDLRDPIMLVSANPSIIYQITSKVAPLQREGKNAAALPFIIWGHTLRAAQRPELRRLGRAMWKELQRGFKYAEQAAGDYYSLTGEELDITDATKFPRGLTPEPLD